MRIPGYTIEGEIGRGGMGRVFRARAGDRVVAIKVLRSTDPELVARFRRERRVLSVLKSGFVPLLEEGESEGCLYAVMPLLTGGTLRDRLRGPWPVGRAVQLVLSLARAMGEAHARGVIHRDLKPENVLFDGGAALIADLGLAKLPADLATSGSLTEQGVLAGTIAYAAPEQLRDARSATPASDVFSLGAILYECLAGKRLLEGGVLAVVAQLERGVSGPIGALKVSAELQAVLTRALAARPEDRPANGHALARELSALLPARAMRPWVTAVLLVAVTVAAATTSALALRPRPPEPERESVVELTTRAEKLFATDMAAAGRDLDRAIELEPRFALAWVLRARLKAVQKDTDGAIADLTRALELDGSVARFHADRGRLHWVQGDVNAALADAIEAVRLDPKEAGAWRLRAVLHVKRREHDEALAAFERALELEPRHPDALWGYGIRSTRRFERRDFAGARDDLTRAIELAPGEAEYWSRRGVVKSALKDPSAIDDLLKACELAPRSVDVKVNLGKVLFASRNFQGARDVFDEVVALAPERADVYANRGHARLRLGEVDRAEADVAKALELDPARSEAWAVKADLHAVRGERREAIAAATRALELDPDDLAALYVRARSHAELGDREAAIADYERLKVLQPEEVELFSEKIRALR